MFGGLGHENTRSTATRVVTALSCTAAFMSVATTEPGQKPLAGTRTALSCSQANQSGTSQNWRHSCLPVARR